jgi:hypothetical protein
MLKLIRALAREHRRRVNRCKVVDGWCVRHVGEKYCTTHNYAWHPDTDEMPCMGMAVAA